MYVYVYKAEYKNQIFIPVTFFIESKYSHLLIASFKVCTRPSLTSHGALWNKFRKIFSKQNFSVLGRIFFRCQLLYWAVHSFSSRRSKASAEEESRGNSWLMAWEDSVHIALELVI